MGAKKRTLAAPALGLLKATKQRYLGSRDFNGLHVRGDQASRETMQAAEELVITGLVQVVGPDDYMNIHIRPWPSRRTVEAQVAELRSLSGDDYGVALYPTAKAMKGVKLPRKYEDAPFSRAMARGRSTLELAYFSADVLETYRNDARFRFGMGDSASTLVCPMRPTRMKTSRTRTTWDFCTSGLPMTCVNTGPKTQTHRSSDAWRRSMAT